MADKHDKNEYEGKAADVAKGIERMKMSSEEQNVTNTILEERSLEGVAKYIKSNKCKNIIVMSGAGLSTAAGIPDFRSPGKGLFDKLAKYNLPNPQMIFHIGYFNENPVPFYDVSKEMFRGVYKPAICHCFIKLLENKNLLLRHYTQNVDGLDLAAGVSEEKVVTAHGTIYSSHCTIANCREKYTLDWLREKLLKSASNDDGSVVPICEKCNVGVVKPDVVLYGEALPTQFFTMKQIDFPKCDLLIVMGTSLKVEPFASLITEVPKTTPRLLINLEKTGECHGMFSALSGVSSEGMPMGLLESLGSDSGFNFGSNISRDVFWRGTCNDGSLMLATLLGWKDDLMRLKSSSDMKSEEKSKLDVKL